MKVLIIGGGGREHALAWKIAQSQQLTRLYCAPGNGGTAEIAENIPISDKDLDALREFAEKNRIDLTIVGPETPLVEGIVDEFQRAGLRIFGPTKAAARLEGSKVFAKEFMRRHEIPTADFGVFESELDVREYIQYKGTPLVIKVDGLAAGKGAYVCEDSMDVNRALNEIYFQDKFGRASDKVIVEDLLTGEELSVFALCNGTDYLLLSCAQDHKQVYDNDEGPNTGGMGAYAPAPLGNAKILKQVEEKVIQPVLKGMEHEGCPFTGVLYCGLMVSGDEVNVLEFNCRFGDPEAQVIIPLIKSDLLEILYKLSGDIDLQEIELSREYATCVVLASGGYPGSYEKGFPIKGLDQISGEAIVFHAGTKLEKNEIVTSGGRVLSVVCLAPSLEISIENVYKEVEKIKFNGVHFRKDIGRKGLLRITGGGAL